MLKKSSETRRRQLIVGNWKMNGNRQENSKLLDEILIGWQGEHNIDVVVCPPSPYLAQTFEKVSSSKILLGGQNLSEFDQGAYTGEVSAKMLADLHCKFVIIGHNERRRYQGEADVQIAQKFKSALCAGIIPILCVGETLAQRESSCYLDVIGRQLQVVFAHVGRDAFAQAVVAYEPVWAVGTGMTALPHQIHEVHRFIREQLGTLSDVVRIIYGGSVNSGNAQQLFMLSDIDGALLGGASLNSYEFLAICTAADLSIGA